MACSITRRRGHIEFVGTFWALVPPIVAIVLALITKETYSSLFVGILVGALLLAQFNPVDTINYMILGEIGEGEDAMGVGFINAISDPWNAGIFIWNIGTIVNALRVYQPTLSKIFEDLLPVYGTAKEQDAINEVFPQCENISIDYAIMEKAEEIYVFPASFGWSDLGTWGSLHENTERDIYGNALIGDNIDVYETTNCIVHATQEKRVVVQGLDGFIVAECDDTLLICRLSDEQRIKQFSENK